MDDREGKRVGAAGWVMTDVKAIAPASEYIEILNKVLEMNEQIVRQNSLIIQSITLPKLIIKPQGENND